MSDPTSLDGELRARVRRLAGEAEVKALALGADALGHVDRRDYSAAATACHRAHQQRERAAALLEVLS